MDKSIYIMSPLLLVDLPVISKELNIVFSLEWGFVFLYRRPSNNKVGSVPFEARDKALGLCNLSNRLVYEEIS